MSKIMTKYKIEINSVELIVHVYSLISSESNIFFRLYLRFPMILVS